MVTEVLLTPLAIFHTFLQGPILCFEKDDKQTISLRRLCTTGLLPAAAQGTGSSPIMGLLDSAAALGLT